MIEQQELFMHDFLAICKKGHKRNFVWGDDTAEHLTKVRSLCVICDCVTTFDIKKYWQEPALESEFSVR